MASGGFDMSFGDFRPNQSGIIEVFTSAGMQAALAEAASAMGEQANAMAHLSHATNGMPEPYQSGVDVLDRTAVGYVSTANRAGRADQSAHHTLDAINH